MEARRKLGRTNLPLLTLWAATCLFHSRGPLQDFVWKMIFSAKVYFESHWLTLSWSLKWKIVLGPLCNFCYCLLITGLFEMLLESLKMSALTALVVFCLCQDLNIWWHQDLAMFLQHLIPFSTCNFYLGVLTRRGSTVSACIQSFCYITP